MHVHPEDENSYYFKYEKPEVEKVRLFHHSINLFGESVLKSIEIKRKQAAGTYEIFQENDLIEHGCDLEDPTTWDNSPCVYIGQANDSWCRVLYDRLGDFRTGVLSGLGVINMQKSPYENGVRYGETHTAENAGHLIARLTIHGYHSINTPLSNFILWKEYKLQEKHIQKFGTLPELNSKIQKPTKISIQWPIVRSNLETELEPLQRIMASV